MVSYNWYDISVSWFERCRHLIPTKFYISIRHNIRSFNERLVITDGRQWSVINQNFNAMLQCTIAEIFILYMLFSTISLILKLLLNLLLIPYSSKCPVSSYGCICGWKNSKTIFSSCELWTRRLYGMSRSSPKPGWKRRVVEPGY